MRKERLNTMAKYALGLYEKAMPNRLSLAEKLRAAKELGYDYVELSIDESDAKLARLEMSRDERRELVETMYREGIPFRSICLSGHRKYPLGSPDPATERRGMEIMEKAIELADDLGIRTIQLAGYDVYYEEGNAETKARFAENILRSTALAARYGVVLGFETMETPFMNTVEKAMEYVNQATSPYLCVYPDLGNLTNAAKTYGTSVVDDIRTGRGHLCALHLKETVPGVFREVPFGTGHVDFASGIATAWDCGVRRFVTEMWDVGEEDWRAEIRSAVALLRPLLDAQD